MDFKGRSYSFKDEEKEFIINNYNIMSNKEIADKLNTEPSRISHWAVYHGIAPKKIKFSQEDISYMKENYDKISYKEIANNLGYTERQVRGKINNMNLSKTRKFNKHYFENIDCSNKAYWLGFIYADGYIIKKTENKNYELGIELNRKDEYHLQKFNEELGGVHKIYQRHKDLYIANNPKMSHVDTSMIRIYSKDIVYDLEKHGIVQNKTNDPYTFPKVEGVFFMDFLRGYIDGDGCLYVNNKNNVSHIHIVSCYDEVLKYIKEILKNEYDINSYIYEENKRKHALHISEKDNMKLLLLLYKDDNCACLKRKYNKYLEIKSLYNSRPRRNEG